jgi:enoyl-CoA hydratase
MYRARWRIGMSVQFEIRGQIAIVTIDRPERRNAVDAATARALDRHFVEFERDERLRVAILTGSGGSFCAGADLRALAEGERAADRLDMGDTGPMGPTRRTLGKPVIAAIEGFAVAGGLELACWCDLRVAARDAVFGVHCRRVGVPLVDGGTVRLPRLIGQSHAMDLILTGREVSADEAAGMGLVNRRCDPGQALETALALAAEVAAHPQTCLRGDRLSSLQQWSLDEQAALANELRHGRATIESGEPEAGAIAFARGNKPQQ